MKFVSCWFKIHTACVEHRCSDAQIVSVEDEYVENRHQQSELDWLIYNSLAAYAELILDGKPEKYLKAVTKYKFLD